MEVITHDMLLMGYTLGIFPMADPAQNHEIFWVEPEMRGIIPLEQFKVSKSLRQTIRSGKYHATMNTRFEEVIRSCADRPETWISDDLIDLYIHLHKEGFAYSFEVINQQNNLVGGLYGVALGKAFFGESMFSKERDTSKIALFALVEWMKHNGYELLDTQYITDHLKSLGAIEITQDEYKLLLQDALHEDEYF